MMVMLFWWGLPMLAGIISRSRRANLAIERDSCSSRLIQVFSQQCPVLDLEVRESLAQHDLPAFTRLDFLRLGVIPHPAPMAGQT
jgi:hypothetical protein